MLITGYNKLKIPAKNFQDVLVLPLKLFAFPGYLLFFLMLFIPTIHQQFKFFLLLVVLGIIFIRALLSKHGVFYLHPIILRWTLFYATIGLFFMLVGSINSAPGALRVGTVYVLWPLVFTFLISGITNEKVFIGLTHVLMISSLAIGLFVIYIILHSSGLFPDSIYIYIFDRQDFYIDQGVPSIHYKPIESLLFLFPFLVATVLTWSRGKDMPVSRNWLWFALIPIVIVVPLIGRNALLLVGILSFPITFFFNAFLPFWQKQNYLKLAMSFIIVTGLLLLILNIYLSFNCSSNLLVVLDVLMGKFDFQNNPSGILRKEQFFALLGGFVQHPFLGAGHGAGVAYVRSENSWAYELSYVALLYQVGVLGFIAYSSGVIWIYWTGIRIIREGGKLGLYMIPIMVGMTCFLIANATNQYLIKFDFMWIIFLPIAVINHWLINRTKHPLCESGVVGTC
jgi:hypothetical protein